VSGRVHTGAAGTLHWEGDINGHAIELSIAREEGS
jgi:hypothetical protein